MYQKKNQNKGENRMLYTIPDYYKEFRCIADQCEDTCCAGWQIMVDENARKKYGKVKGKFRRRLRRSVDWKEGTFKQSEDKRCAFLNENNLCDLYTALGEKSLCKTCRRYPRHVEEFENVREITLSASCPEAARILLGKEEPVKFLSYEKDGDEEYEDFDYLLYSQLLDVREVMIRILQNREMPLKLRTGLILGLAHDIQVRVKCGELFGCSGVLERYSGQRAKTFVEEKLEEISLLEYARMVRGYFADLYELEYLKDDWELHLRETQELLFGKGEEHYRELSQEFDTWLKEHHPMWEIPCEQLLVYFIFTYFCGAVYDGRAYAKVQMSVVSVLLITEMLKARWLKNEKTLDQEDVIEIVYRYSRELEHSDPNLEKMEKLMERQLLPWFRKKQDKE